MVHLVERLGHIKLYDLTSCENIRSCLIEERRQIRFNWPAPYKFMLKFCKLLLEVKHQVSVYDNLKNFWKTAQQRDRAIVGYRRRVARFEYRNHHRLLPQGKENVLPEWKIIYICAKTGDKTLEQRLILKCGTSSTPAGSSILALRLPAQLRVGGRCSAIKNHNTHSQHPKKKGWTVEPRTRSSNTSQTCLPQCENQTQNTRHFTN